MGTTTFTGPIKAGPILNTSGNTVGKDVADVGFCLMSQVSPVTQAASAGQAAGVFATDIVIPANSTIVSIEVLTTVAWNGAATTFNVGTTSAGTELAVAADNAALPIGVTLVNPGADATRVSKWINVGTTDVRIFFKSTNTGAGVGAVVVNYIQGPNNS